jgi:hypothetical protein
MLLTIFQYPLDSTSQRTRQILQTGNSKQLKKDRHSNETQNFIHRGLLGSYGNANRMLNRG